MVDITWYDSKRMAGWNSGWVGSRIRGSRKRIELRNGEQGVSLLIVITPSKLLRSARKREDDFPAHMSMNGTMRINPEFAQEIKEVLEQGTVELMSILNVFQLEGKGRFVSSRIKGRHAYTA